MTQGESERLNNLSGYTSEVLWEIAEEKQRRATDDREFGPPDEQELEAYAENLHNFFVCIYRIASKLHYFRNYHFFGSSGY